jgi:Transcriptional regulator containing an amidase domain and an AraC-type DNA-binding HTH domain
MHRLIKLPQKRGFDSVLELLSILHDLSTSRDVRILSDSSFNNSESFSYNSRRVENVMRYLNANFDKNVSLTEAAKIAAMTEVSLSRFFKFRTGKTFVDALCEIRLGHASRMLIETTQSINEIATNAALITCLISTASLKRKRPAHQKNSGTLILLRRKNIYLNRA